MARDDEIFRKLKKETPLVKRKDLQPLASHDFAKKSAFDFKVEKQAPSKRVAPKPAASGDLSVFSRESQKKSRASRSAAPVSRPAAKPQAPAARRDLDVFGEKPTVRTREAADREMAQARERERAAREAAQARAQKQAEEERVQKPAKTSAKPTRSKSEIIVPEISRSAKSMHSSPAETRQLAFEVADALQAPANGAMAFRHELKYYINYRDYVLLRNTLKALIPLDSFAGANGDYHIRSLYFDDVYETALREKIAGSDVRSKYRIRIYNFSDGNIKFEKKMKRGEYIAKQSIRLGRDECERLIAGDCGSLEGRKEPLAQEIFLQMRNNCLRPRVTVDYYREAYVSSIQNVRITFDKNLKAGLWMTDIFNADAPTMPVFESGTMVLEVKFDKYLPPYIKGVLNTVNAAERNAISKYVLCRRHD